MIKRPIEKIRERDDGYEKVDYEDQSVDASKVITLEATRILRSDNPFDYILKAFSLDHEGDETLAKCLAMSFASRSVINSKGLHVLTTEVLGKGKSHGYDTMLELIPQEFRLSGRLSDKSLFYSEDLKPRAVICLDDNSLSEQMQKILKGVTSSFKQPLIYLTVNKDRKGENRLIPERCVWWVAKMEGTGDDQVWNWMLTVWVDESREQDDKVLIRELGNATLPPQPEIIRH
jgi:primase-polymerase (primpol)-like protein